LGPIFFNLFINDPDDGLECIISQFIDKSKLGGVADRPGWCALIQRHQDTLEYQVDWNLTKFKKGKSKSCT